MPCVWVSTTAWNNASVKLQPAKVLCRRSAPVKSQRSKQQFVKTLARMSHSWRSAPSKLQSMKSFQHIHELRMGNRVTIQCDDLELMPG